MPLPDLVRTVGDVMSRADSLFGGAAAGAASTSADQMADQLTDVGDIIRSGQDQAASMSAAVLADYDDFAQGSRDAIDHLSGVEADFGRHLQDAAEAMSAAHTSSQSALHIVSSAAESLDHFSDTPTAELAILRALHAQVGQQLELIRTQQALAAQLGEQLRGLGY